MQATSATWTIEQIAERMKARGQNGEPYTEQAHKNNVNMAKRLMHPLIEIGPEWFADLDARSNTIMSLTDQRKGKLFGKPIECTGKRNHTTVFKQMYRACMSGEPPKLPCHNELERLCIEKKKAAKRKEPCGNHHDLMLKFFEEDLKERFSETACIALLLVHQVGNVRIGYFRCDLVNTMAPAEIEPGDRNKLYLGGDDNVTWDIVEHKTSGTYTMRIDVLPTVANYIRESLRKNPRNVLCRWMEDEHYPWGSHFDIGEHALRHLAATLSTTFSPEFEDMALEERAHGIQTSSEVYENDVQCKPFVERVKCQPWMTSPPGLRYICSPYAHEFLDLSWPYRAQAEPAPVAAFADLPAFVPSSPPSCESPSIFPVCESPSISPARESPSIRSDDETETGSPRPRKRQLSDRSDTLSNKRARLTDVINELNPDMLNRLNGDARAQLFATLANNYN